jgi:antibiotic biosynthesis monooxygenase (ABM) superfamily enzyme
MISRIWHGWTRPENAEAYQALLKTAILPGIAARNINGYGGAHLLRRENGDDVEFVTVLWFDSMDAVSEFAGEEHDVAVVPPEARSLLERFDERSAHYDVELRPEDI